MPVPKMKILIVDDEPVNVGVLSNALKDSYEICPESLEKEMEKLQ